MFQSRRASEMQAGKGSSMILPQGGIHAGITKQLTGRYLRQPGMRVFQPQSAMLANRCQSTLLLLLLSPLSVTTGRSQ